MGSRIKRSDMENASPVTLIGADDIKAMWQLASIAYYKK